MLMRMHGLVECVRCRLLLTPDDFDINISAGRRRYRECKVCRHLRLARLHEREAVRCLEVRRDRRDKEAERIEAARAVAGRD